MQTRQATDSNGKVYFKLGLKTVRFENRILFIVQESRYALFFPSKTIHTLGVCHQSQNHISWQNDLLLNLTPNYLCRGNIIKQFL